LPLVHPREMDTGNFPASASDDITNDLDADAPETALSQVGSSASIVFEVIQSANEGGEVPAKAARAGSTTTYVTRRASAVKALPRVQPDPRNAKLQAPLMGVSWHSRSASGGLLAAREASMPRCLWIWNALDASLRAIVVQLDNITCAQWRPAVPSEDSEQPSSPSSSSSSPSSSSAASLLAFCVGTSRVYFWSDNGANGRLQWADLSGPDVSSARANKSDVKSLNFSFTTTTTATTTATTAATSTSAPLSSVSVNALQWSSDGKRLLLKGKEHFVMCDVPQEIGGADED
jgi:hypothetical protein